MSIHQVHQSHRALVSGAIGIIVIVVISLGTALISGGSEDSSSGAAAKMNTMGCVAGVALRAGSVPNGWDVDVQTAAQLAGISPAIFGAQLETESGWNPKAYNSTAQAAGLGQFIPGTWLVYGEGDPYDPHAAIKALGRYMGVLLQNVQQIASATGTDPVMLALAAYNAGPGNVQKYNGVPPFGETQSYVKKIPQLAQDKYSGDCGVQPGAGAAVVVAAAGPGQWVDPLPGGMLTSPFGMRWGVLHAGIDLSIQPAPYVLAPVDLMITWAQCGSDGYGCSVVGGFADGSGYQMRFGHMATGTLKVSVGQSVKAGTQLGLMGATGDVTGPHLHFEIYLPGSPVNAYASNGKVTDPLPMLISKGIKIPGAH